MPPRKRIVKLLCIVLISACALWIGLLGAIPARELQRRLVCAANVKGIGISAKIYADRWDGTTPIIDWLVKTGQIDPKSAKCPCADSPNYVLLFPTPPIGAENDNTPVDNMVLAYEPKSNHGGEGGNVVFGDGHASFVRVPEYDELVNSVSKKPVSKNGP